MFNKWNPKEVVKLFIALHFFPFEMVAKFYCKSTRSAPIWKNDAKQGGIKKGLQAQIWEPQGKFWRKLTVHKECQQCIWVASLSSWLISCHYHFELKAICMNHTLMVDHCILDLNRLITCGFPLLEKDDAEPSILLDLQQLHLSTAFPPSMAPCLMGSNLILGTPIWVLFFACALI